MTSWSVSGDIDYMSVEERIVAQMDLRSHFQDEHTVTGVPSGPLILNSW